MERLVSESREQLKQHFESEVYQAKRKALEESYNQPNREILFDLEKKAKSLGFVILPGQTQHNFEQIFPVIDGTPVTMAHLPELLSKGAITSAAYDKYQESYQELTEDLEKAVRRGRLLQREFLKDIEELDRETSKPLIEHLVQEVQEKFKDQPAVIEYLGEVNFPSSSLEINALCFCFFFTCR
jgi:hypothetical protein